MRRPHRTALVGGLLATTLLATLPAVVLTGTASAGAATTSSQPSGIATSELTGVPVDGIFHLEGHGYGHGHGLSQWGAQGAAEQGVPLATVLGHFYPGTSLASSPINSLRVQLSGVPASGATLWAASGLSVTGADGTSVSPPGDPAHARLRLAPSGSTETLQSSPDGTTWSTETAGLATPVTVADSASLLRLGAADGSSRSYHGSLSISGTTVVDSVSLEDYTRDVVPRESPSGWLTTALQAQAIASRTYAVNSAQHAARGAASDICDSTNCQVYGGASYYAPGAGSATALETSNTDAATSATAGQILNYAGQAAFTQFSASDGGYSSDGGQPYLPAAADPWDGVDPGNTSYTWAATVSAAQLQQRFPAVGRLTALEVTRRDGYSEWGGRVLAVVLHGVSPSGAPTAVTVSGADVLSAHSWPGAADGVRSIWWHVVGAAATPSALAPGGLAFATVTPRVVVDTTSLSSGSPRRVTIAGRGGVPAGASYAVVVAAAGKLSGASVADLQAWAPGASRTGAVRLAALSSLGAGSGSALVRLAVDGSLAVAPSHGRLGLRLMVVGYATSGATAPIVALSHPRALPAMHVAGHHNTSLPGAPTGASAALVSVTASASGGSLSLDGAQLMSLSTQPHTVSTLVPVKTLQLVASSAATVRVQVLGWVQPGARAMTAVTRPGPVSTTAGSRGGLVKLTGAALPGSTTGVLALVTVTAPKAGTLGVTAHGTTGAGPSLATPAHRATTTLVSVPLKDGRLVLTPPAAATRVSVTVLSWS